MNRSLLLISVCLLIGTANVLAQDWQPPNEIVIQHSGEDRIGNNLLYSLREEIDASEQMELTTSASNSRSHIVIRLTTIDTFETIGYEGRATTYSATWTLQIKNERGATSLYLTETLGNCGQDNIESCARSIAADTDEYRRNTLEVVTNLIRVMKPSLKQDR